MLSPTGSLGYRNQPTTTDGAFKETQATINQELVMALTTEVEWVQIRKPCSSGSGQKWKSIISDCATAGV